MTWKCVSQRIDGNNPRGLYRTWYESCGDHFNNRHLAVVGAKTIR